MALFERKKFGLVQAKKSLAYAKSRGKKLTPDVAFGIQVGLASLGYENVAHQRAATEEQHQKAVANFALRNAQDAEAAGTAKANGLRQRCDDVVASIRALLEKVVTTVTNHYRALASRVEYRAEVNAEAYRVTARVAEKARIEAQEIADLF